MTQDHHPTPTTASTLFVQAPTEWLESLPCGYVLAQMNGRIVRANTRLARWCGQSREMLIGQDLPAILAPDSRVAFETQHLGSLVASGLLHELRLDLLRPSGVRQPVQVSAAILRAANGMVDGIALTVMPANAVHRREQSQQAAWQTAQDALYKLGDVAARLSNYNDVLRDALMSDCGQALIATDESGCITAMNTAAEKLTGLGEVEVIGLPIEFACRTFLPFTQTLRDCPVRLALRLKQVIHLGARTRLRRSDGAWRWVVNGAMPIIDAQGALQGALWLAKEQDDPFSSRQNKNVPVESQLAMGLA